jgi:hypothetical protein
MHEFFENHNYAWICHAIFTFKQASDYAKHERDVTRRNEYKNNHE